MVHDYDYDYSYFGCTRQARRHQRMITSIHRRAISVKRALPGDIVSQRRSRGPLDPFRRTNRHRCRLSRRRYMQQDHPSRQGIYRDRNQWDVRPGVHQTEIIRQHPIYSVQDSAPPGAAIQPLIPVLSTTPPAEDPVVSGDTSNTGSLSEDPEELSSRT